MPAKKQTTKKARKPTKVKEEKVVLAKEPRKLGPFDFLNSINAGKQGENLLAMCTADVSGGSMPDSPDKAYVSFMINRGLSYFPDTILFANAMNEYAALPAKMQFDFLRLAIRPMKRFAKWAKKDDDSNDVALIMAEHQYSAEKARDALKLYTPAALDDLRKRSDKGGTGRKTK